MSASEHVWVALECYPYEGDVLLGVGATAEAAWAICEASNGSELAWVKDYPGADCRAPGSPPDYLVTRMEVRRERAAA